MSKIYVSTSTYNNEDTIARSIESIINQTHTDWCYCICNNGSTDKTGEIIEEYAKKDNRIKTFHMKENWVFTEEFKKFLEIGHNLNDDEYLCFFDGDDTYNPDFMEKTLAFAKEEDLDYVVTSSNFLYPNGTTNIISVKDLVITKENFIELMPEFFLSISHAIWGKLYRGDLLRKIPIFDENTFRSVGFTYDAYFTKEFFKNSVRTGFMSYIGYNYYSGFSKNSLYANFKPAFLGACNIIHDKSIEMLEEKATKITDEAINIALQRYCSSLFGHLRVMLLITPQLSNIKKLELVNQVLQYKYLKQAAENKVGMLGDVLKVIYGFLSKLQPQMGNFKQFQQTAKNYQKLVELAKK
ncbi:MAG: glycosyltransferase [Defluviitaleaceae bacterium]|nr:glycosyltransferase [Defluviitaleaceae bacterium]